jgi:hypothetical protein
MVQVWHGYWLAYRHQGIEVCGPQTRHEVLLVACQVVWHQIWMHGSCPVLPPPDPGSTAAAGWGPSLTCTRPLRTFWYINAVCLHQNRVCSALQSSKSSKAFLGQQHSTDISAVSFTTDAAAWICDGKSPFDGPSCHVIMQSSSVARDGPANWFELGQRPTIVTRSHKQTRQHLNPSIAFFIC